MRSEMDKLIVVMSGALCARRAGGGVCLANAYLIHDGVRASVWDSLESRGLGRPTDRGGKFTIGFLAGIMLNTTSASHRGAVCNQ